MRVLFIIVSLLYTFSYVHSQDLIVTNKGDSINCKISKVKKEMLYFTFKHKEEIRNTLLPLSDVKIFRYGFFTESEVPKEKIIGLKDYPKIRASLGGGYSYRIARISSSLPQGLRTYTEELKSGYHYDANLTYYISETSGIGVKYSKFRASNNKKNVLFDYYGYQFYGPISDDISISFIGPTYSLRYLNGAKTSSLVTNISIGYMEYVNNSDVLYYSFVLTGNTVGLAYDINYEIEVMKNLSIGCMVSWISGSLYQYKIDNKSYKYREGEHDNLSRFDFSIGLRYNQ